MPSKARIQFRDKALPAVERLVDSHTALRKGAKGPDPHNTVLQASVFILCAAWERYVEDVLIESLEKLLKCRISPKEFPDSVQIQIKQAVHHENLHHADILKLAGDGWKDVHRESAQERIEKFNTPKPENIDKLFFQQLGLKDLSAKWSTDPAEIKAFVVTRGDIAHNGIDAEKVSKDDTIHFKTILARTVKETDEAIYEFLKAPEQTGKAPWQKTAK